LAEDEYKDARYKNERRRYLEMRGNATQRTLYQNPAWVQKMTQINATGDDGALHKVTASL
jgi:hypothetical protein